MNSWYISMICLLLVGVLAIAFTGFLVLLVVNAARKKPKKKAAVCLSTSAVLLAVSVLFIDAHSTCIRYNDRWIVGRTVSEVESFYGEFDTGSFKPGQSGRVGYYIYTDNGPVMPDHLDHYYYIEYDRNGVVHNVYDGCQPGG